MAKNNKSTSLKIRIIHRYLGFFLAGIMAVYALSGIILIFRDSSFLKSEVIVEQKLEPNLTSGELGPKLKMPIKIEKTEGDVLYFDKGSYNLQTGMATVKKMQLPFLLEKMNHLHKASTKSPLYFLNIFFGLSLLFFALSAFWLYTPKKPIFKKGMYFAFGGFVLTIALLFL